MKAVNPIGSCYDATAHQVVTFLKNNRMPRKLRVCHGIGIATAPGEEGTRITHCWLEFFQPKENRTVAFDCIYNQATTKERFRSDFQVEHVVEYDVDEFFKNWAKFNYPGPWDEKIVELQSELSKKKKARMKECSKE